MFPFVSFEIVEPGLNDVISVLQISLIAFSSFSLRLVIVDGYNGSMTLVEFCERIESIVLDSLMQSRKSLFSNNERKSSLNWLFIVAAEDVLLAIAATFVVECSNSWAMAEIRLLSLELCDLVFEESGISLGFFGSMVKSVAR